MTRLNPLGRGSDRLLEMPPGNGDPARLDIPNSGISSGCPGRFTPRHLKAPVPFSDYLNAGKSAKKVAYKAFIILRREEVCEK